MMKEIISDKFSILFEEDGYAELANFILKNNFNKILLLTDKNTKKHCLKLFLYKSSEITNSSFVSISIASILLISKK